MKIALIGQDIPTLLPGLLTDLLFAGRAEADLTAEEKNPAMTELLQGYGDAVRKKAGAGGSWTVSADRKTVLDGADCVIYAGDCQPGSRFRMDREALSGIYGMDEGLERRLMDAARRAGDCPPDG